MSTSTQIELDQESQQFVRQMIDWVQAGLTKEQVVKTARKEWSQVPQEFVERSYDDATRILAQERPTKKVSPFRDACMLHRKRKKFLRKIEAKIDAHADAPLSLLTLYRGILRDCEASCHKLLALQRTQEQDQLNRLKDERLGLMKKAEATAKNDIPPWEAYGKKFKEVNLAGVDLTKEDDEDAEDNFSPAPSRKSSWMNGVTNGLLIVALALALLAVVGRDLPRSFFFTQSVETVVERLQTDAQLVGSGRFVPLVLVQHRQDVLDFNILQRPAIAADAWHGPGTGGGYWHGA